MDAETAAAFSQGEFRGMVLTKLDYAEAKFKEHIEDHKRGLWDAVKMSGLFGSGGGAMALGLWLMERAG